MPRESSAAVKVLAHALGVHNAQSQLLQTSGIKGGDNFFKQDPCNHVTVLQQAVEIGYTTSVPPTAPGQGSRGSVHFCPCGTLLGNSPNGTQGLPSAEHVKGARGPLERSRGARIGAAIWMHLVDEAPVPCQPFDRVRG